MGRLRRARAGGPARLDTRRGDAETARQSTAPPPDSLDEQRRWLDRVLRDADVALYVAYDDERGVDIGTVRLDRRSDREAEMSITVDPDERGRGYSHDLIARGIEAAGNVRIVARVKAGKVRTLRPVPAPGLDRRRG